MSAIDRWLNRRLYVNCRQFVYLADAVFAVATVALVIAVSAAIALGHWMVAVVMTVSWVLWRADAARPSHG